MVLDADEDLTCPVFALFQQWQALESNDEG